MLLYSAAKRRQGAPHSWPVGPSRATGRDRSGRDDLWLRYEPIVEEVAQAKGTQENPHQEEETGSEVARSAIELLLVGAKTGDLFFWPRFLHALRERQLLEFRPGGVDDLERTVVAAVGAAAGDAHHDLGATLTVGVRRAPSRLRGRRSRAPVE